MASIDFKDLPLKYQQQALRQVQEQERKKKNRLANASPTNTTQTKPQKYRNHDVTGANGIKFKSKAEEKRYHQLMQMMELGQISDLKLQPQFTLLEGYTKPTGEKVRRMRYTADYSYVLDGKLVVEDVKSRPTRTKDYLMRKKLMLDKYGITVQEWEDK
jgi:hypothetical protein